MFAWLDAFYRAQIQQRLWLGRWVDLSMSLSHGLAPWVDLAVRWWLGQAFLVSGLLKAADWERAIYLATYEYPVTWMDPVLAAYLGGITELLGAALLMAGLATRAVASALLLLSVLIHTHYVVRDITLFWIALLGWYVVQGAGALSLDRCLRGGLANSALPWASVVSHVTDVLRRNVSPFYALLLRVALGVCLVLSAVSASGGRYVQWGHELQWLLPIHSATVFPASVAGVAGTLLVCGMGTRLVSFGLLVVLMLAVRTVSGVADPGAWWAVFALLLVDGGGRWSMDALWVGVFQRVRDRLSYSDAADVRPHVVIVGAGFGGVACAQALRHVPVRVTLIDKRNYHLFQPLLYQVATTMLAPSDIAVPVRSLFRDQANVTVLLGEVQGVDVAARTVQLADKHLPYDYLVVATGASHGYFGRNDWAALAPGLKRIEDATEVRRRLLTAFERAEDAETATERQALLTFLIVGGGPTGVELAGAVAELARHGLRGQFRHYEPKSARVVLVQAAARVLPQFPESLSAAALRALHALGVEVLLDSRVEAIDGEGVVVNGRRIASRTVFWAAGVVASSAARWLQAACDGAGRIRVQPDLSVPGLANVYAIGDTALSLSWHGKAAPGLAPVAKQQGTYVAQCLQAHLAHRPGPGAFRYRHLGSLATIGRKAAVADFGALRLSGSVAWWLWGCVHVAFLAGVRNRLSVLCDWFWSYLTLRSGTCLITGEPAALAASAPESVRSKSSGEPLTCVAGKA